MTGISTRLLRTRSLVLLGIIVSCLALYAISEVASFAPTGDRIALARARMLAGTPDLTLKSSKGNYKYKDGTLDTANQGCAVMGTCPTTFTSFFQFTSIRLEALCVAEGIDVDHQFYNSTAPYGKYGEVYKQKFFFPWSKSGSYAYPMLGSFKGKIKNNILTFTYVIKKANEMDLLITNNFEQMHSALEETNRTVKGEFSLEGAITLGAQAHTTTQNYKYSATKKGARGGLLK